MISTSADGRRVVIVTGAAGGIGSAIVTRLVGEGYAVAAVDIDTAGLEALRARVGDTDTLETFAFDLSSECREGVDRITATLGVPYALVNGAAVIHVGSAVATSDEDWARVLENNLTAPFRMCRAVLPRMLARGAGVIVNVGSIGAVVGLKDRAAYCASKAALVGLTRAMAADHAGSGIRVNAVNPGTTETPMVKQVIDASDDPVSMRETWTSRQPVGRMGRPEEIAAAVAFLIADDSAYMSGSIITVDGGYSAV